MGSIFDEDGLIRESYAIALTHLATGAQYMGAGRNFEASLGCIMAAYFFGSNVFFGDQDTVLSSRRDVEKYACLPRVASVLRLFFPTPKPVSIVCTGKGLETLPPSISCLKRIRTINVRDNQLTYLHPDLLAGLPELEELDVSENQLKRLPDIQNLAKLKTLNAMHNCIEEFPVLPSSIVILGLKGNRIESIGEDVFALATALEQLYLTDNAITALPSGISKCRKLRKLQLSHNKLASVPVALTELPYLELLRLAVNDLSDLPERLMRSPALAWVSMQGNPMTDARLKLVKTTTRTIDERDVEVGRVLGSEASGDVFDATYRGRRVAYKVFVDNKSPDGDWRDEMKLACMFNHDGLARVLALVRGEDKICRGFIMEYRSGAPLADRPTQSELLRCAWERGRTFSTGFVINCLRSVCSALEHLHSRCVAHGDVYAHNILVQDDGVGILCDYGAAFVYKKGEVLFEKHDVRAFGLLVRGLIERLDISFDDMTASLSCQKQLLAVAQRCLSIDVDGRPRFKELKGMLVKIGK